MGCDPARAHVMRRAYPRRAAQTEEDAGGHTCLYPVLITRPHQLPAFRVPHSIERLDQEAPQLVTQSLDLARKNLCRSNKSAAVHRHVPMATSHYIPLWLNLSNGSDVIRQTALPDEPLSSLQQQITSQRERETAAGGREGAPSYTNTPGPSLVSPCQPTAQAQYSWER